MIEIRNLSFSFGEKQIFTDLNLDLPEHGIVVLMGESGVGKTTLLRLLLGTLTPNAGTIQGLENRKVSIAFQESRLLEGKNAIANVASVSDEKTAKELLEMLSMEETQKKCKFLSGGQKQRVSLARAFAFSKDAVLLDEPFTGLDEENRKRAAELIKTADLAVIVTHDKDDLELLGTDQIVAI